MILLFMQTQQCIQRCVPRSRNFGGVCRLFDEIFGIFAETHECGIRSVRFEADQ